MKRKIIRCVFMSLCIISISACSRIFPVKINTVLENPRDYADKQVTISGTVEETFSLVVVKYFVLRDETGSIPVITQGVMPVRGNEIKVTGTVQDAFSLGDQNLVVLIEK